MTLMDYGSAAFYDSEKLKLLQRAFEGACWSMGLSAHPRPRDSEADHHVRTAVAKAVIDCAAYGMRDVQALKTSAVRRLQADAA